MYQHGSPVPVPVERLPAEILAHIFTLGTYIEPEQSGSQGVQLDNNENISPCTSFSYSFPILVSSVTKHWRQVALSTSELWSKIFLTADDAMDDSWFYGARLFLSRSGNYALDVFVDARDPEWDFSEFDFSTAGNTPTYDADTDTEYKHPFTEEHMRVALGLIRPQLRRCRSLVVLTDRWAPMHLALNCFSTGSPDGISLGGEIPRTDVLETLILMRCNEFASYTNQFSPEEYSGTVFLPFGRVLDGHALPRLKKLTLSGVHVYWSRLPSLLRSSSNVSQLRSLDLSYHCRAVRPSVMEFRQLLEQCSKLEELSIKVSGPLPQMFEGPAATSSMFEKPISLPRLRKLALGYDHSVAGVELLRMIDAPDMHILLLEDSVSPDSFVEKPADDLLAYLARQSVTIPQDRPFRVQDVALDPLFPLLDTVVLHTVDAAAEAFQMFFASATRLRSLTLSYTPTEATEALRPGRPCDPPFCPCPLLDHLVLRGFQVAMNPVVVDVLAERTNYGAIVRDVQLRPLTGSTQADTDEEEEEEDDDDQDDPAVEVGATAAGAHPEDRFLIGRSDHSSLPIASPVEYVRALASIWLNVGPEANGQI